VQYEIQVIELSWYSGAAPEGSVWSIYYNGSQTEDLGYNIDAVNLRDHLMNLYNQNEFVFGYVNVSRTDKDNNQGYIYSITFIDSTVCIGAIPLLQVHAYFGGTATATSSQFQPGKRPGGTPEIQKISISGTGTGVRGSGPDSAIVRGWWRLLFSSSSLSVYISSEASPLDLKNALQGLNTIGQVETSRFENSFNGYDWLVTFITPVGNLGPLVVDGQFLWTTNGDAEINVFDGNNLLVDAKGNLICPQCQVGEAPVGYTRITVNASKSLAVTISGLGSGMQYMFAVSAKNTVGVGKRTYSSGANLSPPLFEPSPPTNVSISVKTWKYEEGDGLGDDQRLIVSFNPPLSDGGAVVSWYLAEIHPDKDFSILNGSPISEIFYCPDAPIHAVWVIETFIDGNGTVTDGYFILSLARSGQVQKTDGIPFNAVALSINEVPSVYGILNSSVLCIFYPKYYPQSCPPSRVLRSGSIQGKLTQLTTLKNGVDVSRRDTGQGTYAWTVTFLDDGDDFSVQIPASNFYSADSNDTIGITATKIKDGVTSKPCTGSMVVPPGGGLVAGENYYARVTAYNLVGFSLAAYAPIPAKPAVVPGLPTNVMLALNSSSSLVVTFEPPIDNGGDTIDQYLIIWSTSSNFIPSLTKSYAMSNISAGAPFAYTIYNLDVGVNTYVKVAAHNSQGYGFPQATAPGFLSALAVPNLPTNVLLGVTSPSLLTVTWTFPSCCGDPFTTIDGYFIEWDLTVDFDSIESFPDKGNFIVSQNDFSYTISFLTTNTPYFVRVSGFNSAGYGSPQITSPAFARPNFARPGKPVAVIASTGANSGEIDLAFGYPLIPFHSYPCFGSTSAPGICPLPIGAQFPSSDGGVVVYEYRIQWSVDMLFSPLETDSGFGDTSEHIYTITNLTVGYNYFIRIAARTTIGYSHFCEFIGPQCYPGYRINATSHS